MPGIAWVNGMLVDPEQPVLGVQERGFLYGDGLFETVRLRGCVPLDWEQHLERLGQGCGVLKMPCPKETVEAGVQELAARINDGVLRITVSRGESPRGLLPPPGIKPTVVVTGQDGKPYPDAAYESGMNACLVSFPRNHCSPLVQLKSLNNLENILGRQEAAAAGVQEGIFCNLLGEIAEGTMSNFFLVRSGRIITPPPESGLLPGIMRARVISLAESAGISVAEEKIFPEDFRMAEEAFLTNSLMGVMPLVVIDGEKVGNGRPGQITGLLCQMLR